MTGHHPVVAEHGVVATSHPLAAEDGLAVLLSGGNAIDAAVAAAASLTVVEPTSNGLGGDLFALVWDGERLHGLNASGRAPAGLTVEAVRSAGHDAMPWHGWLSVTVPGQVDGWRLLHERWGSLPWERLLTPAIAHAEGGHRVPPVVGHFWQHAVRAMATRQGPEYAGFAETFAPAPAVGATATAPGHARTLRRLAEHGAEDFYTGEVAAAITDLAATTGGLLTPDDLAAHTSEWVEPITMRYRDHEVAEIPPNGQGIATLVALGILDGLEAGDADEESWLHQQVEAMKIAFADTFAHVGDPARADVPTTGMLDPAYLAGRRALIGDRAADHGPGDPPRGGTVLLVAADAEGRMVALIQSNFAGFGSGIVVPGWGLALQNRAAGFVLDDGHPNRLEPGKRPFHTIIPGFLLRGGRPVGPFGVMGGHMQAQGHLQVVGHTVDRGLDPQAALDSPRWRVEQDDVGVHVLVEPTMPAHLVEGLRRRGHRVVVTTDQPNDVAGFGRGQAVWRRDSAAGPPYVAGSESRADGHAAGW